MKGSHSDSIVQNEHESGTLKLITFIRDEQGVEKLFNIVLAGSNMASIALPPFFSGEVAKTSNKFEQFYIYSDPRVEAVMTWSKLIDYTSISEENRNVVSKLVEFGVLNSSAQINWLRSDNGPVSLLLLGACYGPAYVTHEIELDMKGKA
jgi:hypothetical protein